MANRYRITINKRGHIPGVGNGPIRRPIAVTQKVYDMLVKLGYPIEVVQDLGVTKKKAKEIINQASDNVSVNITNNEVKEPEVPTNNIIPDEEKHEEVIKDVKLTEDVIDNEEIVDSLSEDTTEEDEILVDDKDLSPEAFYTEEFLSSKNICKKILDAREVSYDDSASYTVLKKLVSESNPEIEE